MVRALPWLALALALPFAPGCGCDGDAPLVLVWLRTDRVPQEEFVVARVDVETPEGRRLAREEVPAEAGADYLEGVRLLERNLPSGALRVDVALVDASGATVGRRTVMAEVRGSLAVTVVIARSAAACDAAMCGEGETCGPSAACVDERCTPETPTYCPAGECTTGADCPARAACSVATCASGTCLYGERPAGCALGDFCHPDDGCMPRTVPLEDGGRGAADGGGGATDGGGSGRDGGGSGRDGGGSGRDGAIGAGDGGGMCSGPEICNLVDDDCNGSCDTGIGCRDGVHRKFHESRRQHLYTRSLDDGPTLTLEAENYFRIYRDPAPGLVPIYRCYWPTEQSHLISTDAGCEGAVNEGVYGYVATSPVCGAFPLYELRSAVDREDYLYTLSAAERDDAVSMGARDFGVVGYVWLFP